MSKENKQVGVAECVEETKIDWERECHELQNHISYLQGKINRLEGEVSAYRFCIRCNGVSGAEVTG